MFEDKASEPIGTGPYVLKNFQKDSAATFVKNDKFKAEDGEYQIDNVVMKICDTSTELQELQKELLTYYHKLIMPIKLVLQA